MPYTVKGKCVVYKHIRLDSNQVFYIGVGKTDKRPYSKVYRNKHWHNVVNKAGYSVEIILNNLTWEEALQKERELIKEYGRLDNKTGILVNMTDGGEGVNGYKHTEEWKLANSIRNKNKIISEEQKIIVKTYMKNRKITDEFKANVSKGVIKYYDEIGRKIKKETHDKKDLVWVNKNEINTKIFKNDIDKYLIEGWVLGRFIQTETASKMAKKGSKWMNNGVQEAMILNDNINHYLSLNWVYGRLKKAKNAVHS